MSRTKRPAIVLLAVAFVAALGIGGTAAWLTAESDEVVNTFTVGDVDIELAETTGDTYQMVPGCTIGKDPVVTVKSGSEDCWVFVKVDKSSKFDDFISCTIDPNNWTKLEESSDSDGNETSVWYCKATGVTDNRKIKVLGYNEGESFVSNQVLVKDTVTKQMMDDIDKGIVDAPALTFTAYAVQLYESNDKTFSPEEAWLKVRPEGETNQ